MKPAEVTVSEIARRFPFSRVCRGRRGRLTVGHGPAPVPHKTPGSSNGRTVAFEAINLRSSRSPGVLCGRVEIPGSSPGPAALRQAQCKPSNELCRDGFVSNIFSLVKE